MKEAKRKQIKNFIEFKKLYQLGGFSLLLYWLYAIINIKVVLNCLSYLGKKPSFDVSNRFV